MLPTVRSNAPRKLVVILFCAVFVVLLLELVLVLPQMLEVWQPYDYWQFTQMGSAVLNGQDPAAPGRYYPLPTVLWLFVPLALLPDWFRLVWVLVPFASLLYLFRLRGLILFLFTPLWVALGHGTFDPLLLIPIAWLLLDGPLLAPLGAVLLLLKPQLALFAVAYCVLRWLATRQWRKAALFFAGFALFYLPAFALKPDWLVSFIQLLPLRAAETSDLRPLLTSSLWSWWGLDNPLRLVSVLLLIATAVLFVRAVRLPAQRPAALIALGLLLIPIFYASSVVAILPALHTTRQIAVVTGLSLVAFAAEQVVGSFGGLYALIPLAVLYFLHPHRSRPMSPF